MIRCAVSGMNGSSSPAPIEMPSTRLYRTVASLSFFASSFASTHGSVSSMYLLQRLNRLKISVSASATRSSAIFASTLSYVPVATAFRSSSTASAAPLSSTTPPKYLLLMEIVLLTRFPSVFARSEFSLSTIRSHVIEPSFSYGISCSTK